MSQDSEESQPVSKSTNRVESQLKCALEKFAEQEKKLKLCQEALVQVNLSFRIQAAHLLASEERLEALPVPDIQLEQQNIQLQQQVKREQTKKREYRSKYHACQQLCEEKQTSIDEFTKTKKFSNEQLFHAVGEHTRIATKLTALRRYLSAAADYCEDEDQDMTLEFSPRKKLKIATEVESGLK